MTFTNDFIGQDIVGHNIIFGVDVAACQRIQDNKDECWQALIQELINRLEVDQIRHEELETKYEKLTEKLADSEARNRALTEAAAAQAQQFSQTLKQLRQNQLQIVQSEKMASLGQLVAGVAHEINNPVNFIYGNLSHATEYTEQLMGLLQIYQRHYPQPVAAVTAEMEAIDFEFITEDLPKLLNSMRIGAERIQKIVVSLRNFSRMDEADMKTVDIHEGIESTLMILQNRLKAKPDHSEISIIRDYETLPNIECYAGQLNQVFMNILVNAIDALDEASFKDSNSRTEPGKITIRTSSVDSDWVKIVITDNGPGMTENVHRHIFDPFFTTKPVGKGTGLGMSISYQIITEKHGGILECFSTLGVGTELVIHIPVQLRAPHHR